MTIEAPVFLAVRGTIKPANLEEMRKAHNATAGSPEGIAAARELGDLSHKVYQPAEGVKTSNAKPGELLFIDYWVEASGIQKFFSIPEVDAQGKTLFSAKDPTVWMPARGAFMYDYGAPAGRNQRYVGMLRGKVKSPDGTIAGFAKMVHGALRTARRRGQISHSLFVKLGPPNEAVEVLGFDLWHNLDGLKEHYADQTHMAGDLGFAEAPSASVWEQAKGEWSEW